jgi:hypothetical protein
MRMPLQKLRHLIERIRLQDRVAGGVGVAWCYLRAFEVPTPPQRHAEVDHRLAGLLRPSHPRIHPGLRLCRIGIRHLLLRRRL